MTADKRPMRDLVGPGAGFVAADDLLSGATLAGMVEKPFDHVGLQRWARGSFGDRQMLAALASALPSVADPGQTVTGGGGPDR